MYTETTTIKDYGLSGEALLATAVYAILGIAIMVITMMLINRMFGLSLKKELVQEHNTAFGILLGAMAIAIAIIIAGTIAS